MEVPNVMFHPVISFIQKVALYETKSMLHVIGSNNCQSKFRVLKVDRTEPRDLVVVDDKVEYTQAEIHDLVERIEGINKSKAQHRSSSAAKVVSAFGILGFVRFLEGYYIILVTKRQKVAIIGHHSVYKIKDTAMIYIPNDGKKNSSPEELRYLKMFQSIDLKSNFYFSYSYDLTHTLQVNLAPPSDFPVSSFVTTPEDAFRPPQQMLHFGIRSRPNHRFVWNSHLLKPVIETLHPDWIMYITHGFVDQSNVSVYGRSLYVTLIARRSNRYAGTRFLKRGANFEGDVANEVETEQMVHDAGISNFARGSFSSFVQMRGSIPGHWSQDVSKMVPKPQISFDLGDPFGETAGAHFNQLLCRYGAPIIILNLVKKREKKKHESILSEELYESVQYLNQFLPSRFALRYTSFDMARMNKTKDKNVMQRLAEIARWSVLKTGVFVTKPLTNTNLGWQNNGRLNGPRYQTGIVRVNCVDCLDRTNTAQFAVGKYALGYQLCSLGVVTTPSLEFDSDCVRMLEALYEDHGDTLALQYGGSQLVHRIKTYRKTAPWTSQGNDIMQTLSRYYSNTFSDAEKQNTMNLFLGLFIPDESGPHVWETLTDYYLHHSLAMGLPRTAPLRPLSQWWDPHVLKALPRALDEKQKKSVEITAVLAEDESVDGYMDYHRPYELTVLTDTFTNEISHSVRDFMPNFTNNYSPFVVRVRPGRRREESGSKGAGKNPSLTGQSSTSSTASSGTSSSAESDESGSEEDVTADSRCSPSKDSKDSSCSEGGLSFDKLFPPMKAVYGMQPALPKKNDIVMYKRYVFVHINSVRSSQPGRMRMLPACTSLPEDSVFEARAPVVPQASIDNYSEYVSLGLLGACEPTAKNLDMYRAYASQI